MSEKIKYQFVAFPTEWLTSFKLSAQEKIILGVLISFSKNGLYNYGYEKLAEQSCICRRQCIKLMDNLIKWNYVKKHTGQKPVALEVCFGTLGGDCQNKVVNSALECTVYDHNEDKKECTLKQKRVHFEAKNSALECTQSIFKQDLNHNARASAREEMDAGDVTPARSMPNDESAKEVLADSIIDIEDYVLVEDFKKEFSLYLPHIQLLKIGKDFAIRPFPYFQENFDKIHSVFASFFAEKNVKFTILTAKTRKNNEIIINL